MSDRQHYQRQEEQNMLRLSWNRTVNGS